jgi:hypothetical protein
VILESASADPVLPVHETAAALAAQLDQFKTKRKQERFMWMLSTAGLVDVICFSFLPWYGAIFTVLFSLVLLLVAARTCEVPWIVTHLERMFDKGAGSKKPETE